MPDDETGEDKLSRLERTVDAQFAALSAVPMCMPLPPEVTTLMAAQPPALSGTPAPADWPKLAKVAEQVQAMIDTLALRQRELAGRAATVRAARRRSEQAHLLDQAG